MTFSLGRVGLPTGSGGDGLTMAEPLAWEQSGETVTLRGIQDARSLAANNYETNLLWWREQMLGLAHEIGEDAVPVRSTVVSGFDGYYRVVDVGVNHPEGSLNSGTLQATWAIALQRVTQWRQPRFELATAFGTLTNSFSLVGTVVAAAPPNVVDWTPSIPGGTISYATRSTSDGANVNVAYITGPSPDHGTFTGRYLVDMGDHYLGACRVEYDAANNGTYRQVVGYRVIDSTAGMALVRLNNGLVRCTITNSGQNISVSHWDGSQWDTAVPVQVVNTSGSVTTLTLLRASVLRNSPTLCILRCICKLTSGPATPNQTWQVDLAIRRGMRAVFIRATRPAGSISTWRLQFASATASTSISSGGAIRETSNNASGNRTVISAGDAATQDLVNGRITQSSAKETLYGAVTSEVSGSSATGEDTAANQSLETYQLVSETQLTVGY